MAFVQAVTRFHKFVHVIFLIYVVYLDAGRTATSTCFVACLTVKASFAFVALTISSALAFIGTFAVVADILAPLFAYCPIRIILTSDAISIFIVGVKLAVVILLGFAVGRCIFPVAVFAVSCEIAATSTFLWAVQIAAIAPLLVVFATRALIRFGKEAKACVTIAHRVEPLN